MAVWNKNPLLAQRKKSVAIAATGTAWGVILAAGLVVEAVVQSILSVLVPAAWPASIVQHIKTVYSLLVGSGALLTLLWVFQFFADLVQCVKPRIEAKLRSVPPSTRPPAPKTASTPPSTPANMEARPELGAIGSGGVARPRHISSPYQRSASPYSKHSPVTTPQELTLLQKDFAEGLSSATRGVDALDGYGQTPGSLTGTPGSASEWDGVARANPYYSSPAVYQFQQLAGDGTLPSDLPKYHYSLQSSGAGPTGTATALHPSAPQQVADVMRRLQMSRSDLRVWAERLRYWASEQVLQPLLQRMADANARVTEALQRCPTASSSILLVARPLVPSSGQWGDVELCSDEEFNQASMQLQMLLGQQSQAAPYGALSMTSPQNAASQSANVAAIRAALKALKDYKMLTMVLRGDFPNKGILGNCPPGYLGSRISALATDSCCAAFKWQGGGEWGGRAWTRDLPTDTHVLLYILGGFLSAPFWQFEDTRGMILGPGGPLYVGALPARKPQAFTAILATKPKKEDMAQMKAALLLLPGAGGEPLILLVLDGKPTITLVGEWACFEKFVLFLVFVQLELASKIGYFSLDYLLLENVLAEVPINTSVRQRRWFGILT